MKIVLISDDLLMLVFLIMVRLNLLYCDLVVLLVLRKGVLLIFGVLVGSGFGVLVMFVFVFIWMEVLLV